MIEMSIVLVVTLGRSSRILWGSSRRRGGGGSSGGGGSGSGGDVGSSGGCGFASSLTGLRMCCQTCVFFGTSRISASEVSAGVGPPCTSHYKPVD